MGEVFAGIDETLQRPVALKAIRADLQRNALDAAQKHLDEVERIVGPMVERGIRDARRWAAEARPLVDRLLAQGYRHASLMKLVTPER